MQAKKRVKNWRWDLVESLNSSPKAGFDEVEDPTKGEQQLSVSLRVEKSEWVLGRLPQQDLEIVFDLISLSFSLWYATEISIIQKSSDSLYPEEEMGKIFIWITDCGNYLHSLRYTREKTKQRLCLYWDDWLECYFLSHHASSIYGIYQIFYSHTDWRWKRYKQKNIYIHINKIKYESQNKIFFSAASFLLNFFLHKFFSLPRAL